MTHKIFILLLFIVSFESSLLAQDSLNMQEKNKYNISELVHESGLFVIQPIKWNGKDWMKFGIVIAGTFALHQLDQRTYNVALHNPGYSNNSVLFVGKQWGGFFFPPALTFGLYIQGCIAGNNTTKKIGFELAQAILYSELISFPMKGIAGRSRPKFNYGPSTFHPFTSMADSPRNSFPAGHVGCAFAVSTVLSGNINSGFLKVLVYAPAVVCAAERMYQGDHWLSDCFFGAALGTFSGIWVVKMHEKKESRVHISAIYPPSVRIDFN